ncbi:MAG TPA: metal-dependent hydrolase [Candidatus Binatia bacterium]|nr:metal-dependent hydrolase [Candidatus Binatia bacterium]
MDPLTHALVGAAAARVALARPLGPAAWLPGIAGALIPDLDGLARLSGDPLAYATYHRHFTHALLFAPVGGAVAALPWLLRPAMRGRWLAVYAAAVTGYASHGLLDAVTSYGTLLFWPFSNARVSLSWISVIDPLFTLALAVGVAAAAWRRRAGPAALALLVGLGYLALGAVQRERALDAQQRIAAHRGDARVRGDAFPTIGNHLVWRSLYQVGDTLRLDRIRVPWFGPPTWAPTTAVPAIAETQLPSAVQADPLALRDFRRFRWFSGGWVAPAPEDPALLGDARYSLAPGRYAPIWAIRLRPGQRPPVEWVDRTRDRSLEFTPLWQEITGRHPDLRPLVGAPAPGPPGRAARSAGSPAT